MGKVRSRAALLGAIMAVATTLAGCGSSGARATKAATVASTGRAAVSLHLTRGNYSVSAPGTTISGTASKGALISVNGSTAAVHSGHWHDRLHLHIGSNQVRVEATMSGRPATARVIHVVRHHSTAELEALAHARVLRAEVQQKHEAEARERKQHEAEAREHKQHEEAEKREHEQTPTPTECPNGTYENSAGNIVCKPYAPSNGEQPAGATARCEDGTYSFSESRSGTCSHHGGVAEWLN